MSLFNLIYLIQNASTVSASYILSTPLESLPRVTLFHSQGLNIGAPLGIQVAQWVSTRYPLFKRIHCRLIGITWLEMLTLVFLNKVSINS